MRIGAFCALILHIYYGVGYCVVYFRLGLTTTFSRMNESQLHTFFVCGQLVSFGAGDLMELETWKYLNSRRKP